MPPLRLDESEEALGVTSLLALDPNFFGSGLFDGLRGYTDCLSLGFLLIIPGFAAPPTGGLPALRLLLISSLLLEGIGPL